MERMCWYLLRECAGVYGEGVLVFPPGRSTRYRVNTVIKRTVVAVVVVVVVVVHSGCHGARRTVVMGCGDMVAEESGGGGGWWGAWVRGRGGDRKVG